MFFIKTQGCRLFCPAALGGRGYLGGFSSLDFGAFLRGLIRGILGANWKKICFQLGKKFPPIGNLKSRIKSTEENRQIFRIKIRGAGSDCPVVLR